MPLGTPPLNATALGPIDGTPFQGHGGGVTIPFGGFDPDEEREFTIRQRLNRALVPGAQPWEDSMLRCARMLCCACCAVHAVLCCACCAVHAVHANDWHLALVPGAQPWEDSMLGCARMLCCACQRRASRALPDSCTHAAT